MSVRNRPRIAVGAVAIALAMTPQLSSAELVVTLFFVDIANNDNVSSDFYACGDSRVAGPFMSGATAIEWRDQFLPSGGKVFNRSGNEPGVCAGPPLYREGNAWQRG